MKTDIKQQHAKGCWDAWKQGCKNKLRLKDIDFITRPFLLQGFRSH